MTQEGEPSPPGIVGRMSAPSGAYQGIVLLESSPESIKLHRIEDHELEMLMNISQPVSLAVSCATFGAGLGLLPSVFGSFTSIAQQKTVSPLDVALIIISSICFSIFVVTGFYAIRGQRQAKRTLDAIHARPLSPR